jgi:tetratricopeptide (TPR) repeat protein
MGKPIKTYPLSLKIILITFLITFFPYSCGTIDQWTRLNMQALTLVQQGQYSEAEKVAKEALQLAETKFGPDDPFVANSLNNLANLYYSQGKYFEAEPLYKRSLKISEKAYRIDYSAPTLSLSELREYYYMHDMDPEIKALYYRSANPEKVSPDTYVVGIDNYVGPEVFAVLSGMPATTEQINAGWDRVLGPGALALVSSLNGLANLYYSHNYKGGRWFHDNLKLFHQLSCFGTTVPL